MPLRSIATLVVAGLMVLSCGQPAKDPAPGPEGGEAPTSTAAARKNKKQKKPPAPQVPRCAYPKGDGDCWTSTQVPPWYRQAPTEDRWGEIEDQGAGPAIPTPLIYNAMYSQTWTNSKTLSRVSVDLKPYVLVDIWCGRTDGTGFDMDVKIDYDRIGLSGGLSEEHTHEEWEKAQENYTTKFSRSLTATWNRDQVHLELPASQAVYYALLHLFLPTGTDVTLRGIEFIDFPYDEDVGTFVTRPGTAKVDLWGHCGHVDVSGPGNGILSLTGQVDGLKVDLPKGAVVAWLEPGTPADAPIEIHAKAAVVNLPEEQHLAGQLPANWATGTISAASVQGDHPSDGKPHSDAAHPATLDAPLGLVRQVHWGQVDDVSDADEGPARRLDIGWAVAFASQGTSMEQRLPPPDCIDMLTPACDRYAGRKKKSK